MLDPSMFTGKLTSLTLVKNLLESVKARNNETQQSLDKSAEEVGTCPRPRVPSPAKAEGGISLLMLEEDTSAAPTPKHVQAAYRAESECVKSHGFIDFQYKACLAQMGAWKTAVKSTCQVYGEEKPTNEDCNAKSQEDPEAWAMRLVVFYKERYESMQKKQEDCDTYKAELRKLDGKVGKCTELKLKHQLKQDECLKAKDYAKAVTCSNVNNLPFLCKMYDECYQERVKTYKALKTLATKQLACQKQEWRVLKRIECLGSTMDDTGQVVKKKLDKCNNLTNYDTSHLTLKYPKVPAKNKCSTKPSAKLDPDWVKKCNLAKGTVTPAP